MDNNISFENLTGKQQEQPPKNSKKFAIASLVLGIISILCCCIGYVPMILGVLAIVFFAIDYKSNKRVSGMAIAGLVCGIFGFLIGIGTLLAPIIFKEWYGSYDSIYSSIMQDIYGSQDI